MSSINILEENQWYSSEEIKKSIEDKKDEDSRDINRRPRT